MRFCVSSPEYEQYPQSVLISFGQSNTLCVFRMNLFILPKACSEVGEFRNVSLGKVLTFSSSHYRVRRHLLCW